jgi:N utilization substance protein A
VVSYFRPNFTYFLIRARIPTAIDAPSCFYKGAFSGKGFVTYSVIELFKIESSEIASGVVEIVAVAREPGSRSKIAVKTNDNHIDPVGACVGQRGARVSTITDELSGEKIDVIEWSEDAKKFVEDALSPAKVQSVSIDNETNTATVEVAEDQQSLAIGKGGQNVRLAAKLTNYRIDIKSVGVAKEDAGGEEDTTI